MFLWECIDLTDRVQCRCIKTVCGSDKDSYFWGLCTHQKNNGGVLEKSVPYLFQSCLQMYVFLTSSCSDVVRHACTQLYAVGNAILQASKILLKLSSLSFFPSQQQ